MKKILTLILALVMVTALMLPAAAADETVYKIGICNYVDDIYLIAKLLARQRDVELVEEKDYIKSPKESGYRSLHLVVRIPVFLSSHSEMVPVEVQIRTIAMDFWASLEHQLRYKSDQETTAPLRKRLQKCAEISAALDKEMQDIYFEINT